ncbi:MAG TPA: endonuclease domain-containing protein [bacterium]|jgi:very-short-patch-repair endonuclease
MRTLNRNPVTEETRERARVLRKGSTKPEKILWRTLRAYQTGVKFRRQYPIGSYIADFYSPDLALVIEVDGGSHDTDDARSHDLVRDDYLRTCGLTVRRFTNYQVCHNLEEICSELAAIIESQRK